jgi:hypothetical protein
LYVMLQAPAFQGVDQYFAGAGVPEIHRAQRPLVMLERGFGDRRW